MPWELTFEGRMARGKACEARRERGSDMIDTTIKMRELVKGEPLFGDFLRSKGFPFTTKNPVTALVTFDDVVRLKKLDKDAFLAEYEAYKAEHEAR